MITKFKKLILFLFIVLLAACNSGTGDLDNRQSSQDPFGAQVIVVDSNLNVIYGNLSDLIEVIINVNEQLTPDGTQVSAQLNSTSLPLNQSGCILSGDNFTSDGQAVIDLLAPLYIDQSPETTDDPPATVNVGVTLTRASGQMESDFVPVTINPVRMIAPEDTEITTNPIGAPTTVFITLQFMTEGIPVGTIVEFEVSDAGIGNVDDTMVPVEGTKAEGQAIVQYTTINGTGGTQAITGKVVFPNPTTMDPDCPSIPEADRTLEAVVVIDQSAPDEEPEPEMEIMCNDTVDNEMDGFTDCADMDCDGANVGPGGAPCETGAEMTCFDTFDNDADGFTDCEDVDCNGEDGGIGDCEFGNEATCDDLFDNDADGAVDCADANCTGSPACP